MNRPLRFLAIALVAATGFSLALAEQPQKGRDVFTHSAPGSVRLTGRLGKKLDLCVSNRLLAQDIDAIVDPFQAKTETGSADWRSEYWGKWFTSLALADAYRSSSSTRAMLSEATKRLVASAAPDGYIGTRVPSHRLEGWDVWGCKYVLLGLIADYDRSHDKSVLEAAEREGDVLIAELGPGKTNIADVGEWNGLPASSVLEPIVQLYERTQEKRFLQFAHHIIDCWSRPSKRLPNGMRLIENALAGKDPDQMCAPKAYEMMSCYEGLCELYRVTGEQSYLQASVKLADGIFHKEATLIGVGTSDEVWFSGVQKQTGPVHKPMETCVTVTWMKFCDQLLRETGDARYADELEKNLYNGLLGAMVPDGKWWAYFSGLMGVRVPSYVQHADVGLSCCVVNGPRGLMLTPFWAFMESAHGPVVNLYAPGTAQVGDVKLNISGDYPVGDQATIRVTPKVTKAFDLSFRIPIWSEHTEVKVNGKHWPPKPAVMIANAGYYTIHRTWMPGDTVTLKFDMRAKLVQQNGQVAVMRGPLVLALDNRLNPTVDRRISFDKPLDLKPNPVAAKKIGALAAYDWNDLTFCDYASAGNAFSEQNIYRTWLPQPLNLATVFQTGQSWQSLTHAQTWTTPPGPRPQVENRSKDLALAANGATALADSEYAKEPGCTSKLIDGILATPEDFSNRWHSSLETPHPHWVEIHLSKLSKIGKVIIHFADPEGYPTSFEGIVTGDGHGHQVFNVTNNHESRTYVAKFASVVGDSLRLVIRSSANPKYPNAAQISEIEIYER